MGTGSGRRVCSLGPRFRRAGVQPGGQDLSLKLSSSLAFSTHPVVAGCTRKPAAQGMQTHEQPAQIPQIARLVWKCKHVHVSRSILDGSQPSVDCGGGIFPSPKMGGRVSLPRRRSQRTLKDKVGCCSREGTHFSPGVEGEREGGVSLGRLRSFATGIWAFTNFHEPAAPPLGSANALLGAGSQRKHGAKELCREA